MTTKAKELKPMKVYDFVMNLIKGTFTDYIALFHDFDSDCFFTIDEMFLENNGLTVKNCQFNVESLLDKDDYIYMAKPYYEV